MLASTQPPPARRCRSAQGHGGLSGLRPTPPPVRTPRQSFTPPVASSSTNTVTAAHLSQLSRPAPTQAQPKVLSAQTAGICQLTKAVLPDRGSPASVRSSAAHEGNCCWQDSPLSLTGVDNVQWFADISLLDRKADVGDSRPIFLKPPAPIPYVATTLSP